MSDMEDLLSAEKKFDWSRLIPRFRTDTYSYGVVGIEFTWRRGLGIGLGVGRLDLWAGWPTSQQSLHNDECSHDEVAEPVDS